MADGREFRLEYFRFDTAKTADWDGRDAVAQFFAHYSTRVTVGTEVEKVDGDVSCPTQEVIDFIQADPAFNGALANGTTLLQALPTLRAAIRKFVKSKVTKLANAQAVS